MSEPISEREELARILAENGATSPDGIHSWRCAYFEWYGPCGCVDELLDDLAARDARIRADIAAEVLGPIEAVRDSYATHKGTTFAGSSVAAILTEALSTAKADE